MPGQHSSATAPRPFQRQYDSPWRQSNMGKSMHRRGICAVNSVVVALVDTRPCILGWSRNPDRGRRRLGQPCAPVASWGRASLFTMTSDRWAYSRLRRLPRGMLLQAPRGFSLFAWALGGPRRSRWSFTPRGQRRLGHATFPRTCSYAEATRDTAASVSNRQRLGELLTARGQFQLLAVAAPTA